MKLKHKTTRRYFRRLFKKSQKRIVRYGILTANFALLAVVVLFVMHNQNTVTVSNHSAATGNNEVAANPLDQLSSAEIAVHVANMVNMDPEEVKTVTSEADTVNIMTATLPADTKVVAKPQVVNTALKTKKDIQHYVAVQGDTIASIAAKFSVSSDSIRWSNGLSGNNVAAGKDLLISPISDGVVYVVKSGDTADSVAQKYHANKDVLIDFNDAERSGLIVGDTIVIPGGSVQIAAAPVRTALGGGSFGGLVASSIIPTFGDNNYPRGQCTWWAANRRAEIGRPVPNMMGNASSWLRAWRLFGFPYGRTPAAGAVIYFPGNHVGFVESVGENGDAHISDMNWYGAGDDGRVGGFNRVTYRTIPADQLGSYYFLY